MRTLGYVHDMAMNNCMVGHAVHKELPPHALGVLACTALVLAWRLKPNCATLYDIACMLVALPPHLVDVFVHSHETSVCVHGTHELCQLQMAENSVYMCLLVRLHGVGSCC